MANGKSNNKKKAIDFSVKRVKKTKEFLLLDVNLYEIVDGLVDGKVYIKTLKRFGKEYYQVKNKVSSL